MAAPLACILTGFSHLAQFGTRRPCSADRVNALNAALSLHEGWVHLAVMLETCQALRTDFRAEALTREVTLPQSTAEGCSAVRRQGLSEKSVPPFALDSLHVPASKPALHLLQQAQGLTSSSNDCFQSGGQVVVISIRPCSAAASTFAIHCNLLPGGLAMAA